MNKFTVKKTNVFPPTGVPSCFYMKPVGDGVHFEMQVALKDGSKLLKLACGDKLMMYSSLIVTGPPAAIYDSTVTLNLNASGGEITSYDVSVDNGATIQNITGNTFDVTMSHEPGDIVTTMFIPKDDIGTNYYPVTFGVLVTKAPPIDSGLTLTGADECEQDHSFDLVLDDYSPDVETFQYRIGVGSWITIDPAQPKPKTITISPVGDVDQIIPIEVQPLNSGPEDFLPVIHNVKMLTKAPLDDGCTIDCNTTAPQNLPFRVNLTADIFGINGYTVFVDTVPQRTWEFGTPDKEWYIDVSDVAVGTVLTITAIPHDGTDQPYTPITKSFTVEAPITTSSGVVISGPSTVQSGEPYIVGIDNTNPDVVGYHILWNGEDMGIIMGDPDEWIKAHVDEVVGDSVDIVFTPISGANAVYQPITKTIAILARPMEDSGLDVSADNEYAQYELYEALFIKDDVNPKVNNIGIKYNGAVQPTQSIGSNSFTKNVTDSTGTTIEVEFTPLSDDANYNFFPIIISFNVIPSLPITLDIDYTYNETVYPGGTNTFTWVNPPDVSSTKIYIDGVYKTTVTGGSYTTPPSSTTPGTIHTVTFEPLSDTTNTYNEIDQDYAVIDPPEPVDSTISWDAPAYVDVGAIITFDKVGSINDLDRVEAWLDGAKVADILATQTSWTYDTSGVASGTMLNFVFKYWSTIPNRSFVDNDTEVLITDGMGVDMAVLNGT